MTDGRVGRATKKVRRREEDLPDVGGESRNLWTLPNEWFFGDEDSDLKEGDVMTIWSDQGLRESH